MRRSFRLGILLCLGLIGCMEPARGSNVLVTAPAETATYPTVTATPFQPVSATATTAAPVAVTEAPPRGIWQGIDFTDTNQRITVKVEVPDLPVQMAFRPGWPCNYIDGRACVGLYEEGQSRVLLVTVHSGVGGDGQPLRHALEGTGWNSAGLSLAEIASNLQKLRSASVSIRQGEMTADRLRIVTALRVPPDALPDYVDQPVTEALAGFAQSDPALAQALDEPLLVIETCGWRHLDEYSRWLVDDTTGSIYLLVIAGK